MQNLNEKEMVKFRRQTFFNSRYYSCHICFEYKSVAIATPTVFVDAIIVPIMPVSLLDFKSARITQDFRAIFTQSGNTVLLVYIGHHDDAYLWASRRLKGFDAANTKPVYEYFEQCKLTIDPIADETIIIPDNIKSDKTLNVKDYDHQTDEHPDAVSNQTDSSVPYNATPLPKHFSIFKLLGKFIFALSFFLLGVISGIIITIGNFM